jgi:hypothetical protein
MYDYMHSVQELHRIKLQNFTESNYS